eukprot:Opistho-2@44310
MGSAASTAQVAPSKTQAGIPPTNQAELNRLRKEIDGLKKEVAAKPKTKEGRLYDDVLREKDEEINKLKANIKAMDAQFKALRKAQEIITHNLAAAKNDDEKEEYRRMEVCAEVDQSILFDVPVAQRNRTKTPSDQSVIEMAVSESILFTSMDEAQKLAVIQEMYERRVKAGDVVIKQGDDDAIFYVISGGDFEVLISTDDGVQQSVLTIGRGKSFGELALMYNCPRNATVKARTDGVLWAIDRASFRTILRDISEGRMKECKDFLRSVPVLGSRLREEDLTRLTVALEEQTYQHGDHIIRQGDHGDRFFILKKGRVIVSKTINETDGQSIDVQELVQGDLFLARWRCLTTSSVQPTSLQSRRASSA